MSRYVSESLAQFVVERAQSRCEYCLISIEDTYFGGEIDHIRSIKHRGETGADNLALACQPCNRNKGSDLGSISDRTGELVRFYNPRTDRWDEHFSLTETGSVEAITAIGEVTSAIFEFNSEERILERLNLIELGRFPL